MPWAVADAEFNRAVAFPQPASSRPLLSRRAKSRNRGDLLKHAAASGGGGWVETVHPNPVGPKPTLQEITHHSKRVLRRRPRGRHEA